MKNLKKGFSLVELSIVIFISSILVVSFLNIASVFYRNNKINENTKKIRIINNAIKAFVIKNKRLPVPADIKLKLDDDDFGKENENSVKKIENSNIYVGTVPILDIGLSPDQITDTYGNKFVYMVVASCTNSLKDCLDNSESITVNSDDFEIDEVVYTVISNGKNKKGAYGINSSSSSNNNNISEIEKANTYNNINSTIYSNNSNTDDLIMYSNYWNLFFEVNEFKLPCTFEWSDISNKIKNKCSIENYSTVFDTNIKKLEYNQKLLSNYYKKEDLDVRCIVECGNLGELNIFYKIVNNN